MSDIFTAQTQKLTAGVDEQLRETRRATSTVLAEDSLAKVDNAGPDGETPALVAETVGRAVERERGDVLGVGRVTDEASGGMGVETDHEEERKVVRVPESLEALVADLVVRSGVHEEHDEKHEMTGIPPAWV